jgi:hypothetical protein
MRTLIAAVAFSLSALPALANDSTAELGAGGLIYVNTEEIEMRSEDLFISMEEVRVRYEFVNVSDHDVSTLVAFPMPDIKGDIDFMQAVPTEDPVNFLGFRTTVDGAPVTAEVQQRVSAMGIDQTAVLNELGVPLAPHLEATRAALDGLPADAQERLVGLGLAGIEEYDSGQGWERHLAPLWLLSTAFYWQQSFPPGRTVIVEHSYKPSVGSTAGLSFGSMEMRTGPYYEEYARKYCFDRTFLAAVDKRQKPDGNNALMENRIDYILTTAANWAGTIEKFHLTIDKGSPDNLVSFCGEGVSKTGPTRFEMTKENFYPEQDLAIMILTPAPWAQ